MVALACPVAAQADTSVMHYHDNPVETAPDQPGTPIELIGSDAGQPRPKARAPMAPPETSAETAAETAADVVPVVAPIDTAPATGPHPMAPVVEAPVIPPVILTLPAAAPKPTTPAVKVVKASDTLPTPVTTYSQPNPSYVVRSTIVSPFTGAGAIATPLTPWIFFDSGAIGLNPASLPDLDRVGHRVHAALSDPSLQVVITGYTDSSGSTQINRQIATQRARTVARALTERLGIPPSRMVVQGAGEDLARLSSEPQSSVHRRVEVALTRIGHGTIPTDDRCTLPASSAGTAPIKGRLVGTTFESIDDYGGGRLTEYCAFTTH